MRAVWQPQATLLLLLGVAAAGGVLCLYGLVGTLQLGSAHLPGFFLMPTLPPSLVLLMLGVVLTCVGLTVSLGLFHHRKQRRRNVQHVQREALMSSWQVWLSMLVSGFLFCLGLVWLLRHGPHLHRLLERLRAGVFSAQTLLGASIHGLPRQVDSPLAGYTLFFIVLGIYGGLALLALWALVEEWAPSSRSLSQNNAEVRRLERAVAAGIQALHRYKEPRQAIIACYARLEHLLAAHGMPVSPVLTPREWMRIVLQDQEVPAEAFAGLIELFSLARYSLHPLDHTARQRALTYLETIRLHLMQETTRATPA